MNSLNKKSHAWITGHTGFIGQELTKNLKHNFEIFRISRNDFLEKNKFFKIKIHINEIKINNLKKFNKNFLFHLATYYEPKPKSIVDINNIIDSNLLFGLRILNTMGYKFFSKILLTQSYLELLNKKQMTLYAKTKSIFANEVEKKLPKKVIKTYLYDTFGLSDSREKLVNIWLKKLILNKPITIYSKNTVVNLSSREFISKVISKIKLIKPGSYEIRSEVEMKLIELVDFLKEITKSKSNIIIKNDKPVKIIKKYDNLSKILNIEYNENNFKEDICKILNNEKNYKKNKKN